MNGNRIATYISTLFGVGTLPMAPGTWGSAAALPLAWILVSVGGAWLLAAAIMVVFALGWWASAVYMKAGADHDASEIVIDEVVGQWIALLLMPLNHMGYAIAFALFRLFDIWKPGPVRWVETRLKGGLGVMADDVVAGAFAAIIVGILHWLAPAAMP